MKKICFIFLLALLPLATNAEVVEKSGLRYNISTENTTEDLGSLFRGDINGDGKKDVADVVELVNYFQGKASNYFNALEADVNNDGMVDEKDIDDLIRIIIPGVIITHNPDDPDPDNPSESNLISIEATMNDVFGIVNLPGIQINALAAYYGTNDSTIDQFPYAGYDFNVGGREFAFYLGKDDLPQNGFVTFKGDIITNTSGNAGKLFFTVNNQDNEDFDIKKGVIRLEDSQGEASPVKLGNVRNSTTRITWKNGKAIFQETGNKVDDDLYVVFATVAEKDLNAKRFGIEKFIDLKKLQKDLKTRIDDIREVESKNESKTTMPKFKNFIREAAGLVYNLFQNELSGNDNNINASYSPQRLSFFTEEDGKFVKKGQSKLEMLATAVKPLSYNTFWEYERVKDGDWIIEEEIEKAISILAKNIKESRSDDNLNAELVNLDESDKSFIVKVNGSVETFLNNSESQFNTLKAVVEKDGGIAAVNDRLNILLKAYILGGIEENAAERINTYIENASDKLSELIGKHTFTRSVAPIILFETNTGTDRLCEGMFISRGTMHAYLTSWTMELLAPAFKKYVALKKNDTLIQSFALSGNAQSFDFNLTEPGDYTVILSCVDYFGYAITKKYIIHVVE